MNVLFIERNLAKNGVVFDQIQRIKKYANITILNINIGKYRGFDHPDVINVHCPFFPKIEHVKSYLFNHVVLKKIKKIVDKKKIGIIHAHQVFPQGLAAYILNRRYRIPFLVTGRGTDVLVYPNQTRYLRKNIGKVLYNCSAFLGVSNNIIANAIDMGLEKNKAYFIPDGIPENIFSYDSLLKQKTSVNTILFAGSLLPVKNVLRLIKVFSIVAKTKANVRFRIAGEGPLKDEMLRDITRLGIQNSITFLGQLDHGRLAIEMKNADLFCLPSISEGWGNVITEAMSCGTPVVGANVGGIPEQIISDDYGFLCDPYSPEDISDKLLLALDRKDWNYEKISKHGKLYTRDDTAKKITEVYQKLSG